MAPGMWRCPLRPSRRPIEPRSFAVFVLPLVVPGHLDGFEDLLVRLFRFAFEAVQFEYPLAQVGEPHRERVQTAVLLEEQLAEFPTVLPAHDGTPAKSQRFGG